MDIQSWTVSEAKAHLSEILRKAKSEGPQKIGIKDPRIIITEEEWLKITELKPKMGAWLIDNLGGIGDLELPAREEFSREENIFSEE
jgi:hypothetical protein